MTSVCLGRVRLMRLLASLDLSSVEVFSSPTASWLIIADGEVIQFCLAGGHLQTLQQLRENVASPKDILLIILGAFV